MKDWFMFFCLQYLGIHRHELSIVIEALYSCVYSSLSWNEMWSELESPAAKLFLFILSASRVKLLAQTTTENSQKETVCCPFFYMSKYRFSAIHWTDEPVHTWMDWKVRCAIGMQWAWWDVLFFAHYSGKWDTAFTHHYCNWLNCS